MSGPDDTGGDRAAAKAALRRRIAAGRQALLEARAEAADARAPAAPPASAEASAEPHRADAPPSRAHGAAAAEPAPHVAGRGAFPRSHTMRWLSDHPEAALAAGVLLAVLLLSGAPRRAAAWARPAAGAAQGAALRTARAVRSLRSVLAWVRPFLPMLAAALAARSQVRGSDAAGRAGGRGPAR